MSFGRAAGVAKPESGHGPSLREAMQENRAFAQASQAGDARVRRVIAQLTVYLVRDDNEVTLAGEGSNVLQVRPAHDGAGRVVGEVEHEDFGTRSRLGLQHRPGEAEPIVRVRLDRHRRPVREQDRRTIGHIARLMVKDFIPGVEQRPQRQIQRLAHPDCHQHLIVRVVPDAKGLADIAGQGAS